MKKENKLPSVTYREHWEKHKYFSDSDIEEILWKLEEKSITDADMTSEIRWLESQIDDLKEEIRAIKIDHQHDLDALEKEIDIWITRYNDLL
jgi:predicted  nucleic acid-binding Zn-ribbon protein